MKRLLVMLFTLVLLNSSFGGFDAGTTGKTFMFGFGRLIHLITQVDIIGRRILLDFTNARDRIISPRDRSDSGYVFLKSRLSPRGIDAINSMLMDECGAEYLITEDYSIFLLTVPSIYKGKSSSEVSFDEIEIERFFIDTNKGEKIEVEEYLKEVNESDKVLSIIIYQD